MREEVAIDPRDQVLGHVHEGHVVARRANTGDGSPAQQNPVADERGDERDHFRPCAVVPEIEETHHEIADGNALQHAVEAHVRQFEEREAVDHDAKQNQNHRPLQSMPGKVRTRCAARQARIEGEDDRHANDEYERRKDEVGRR